MKQNEFNFYCDESHHIKSDGQDFMVLGTIYCPKNKVKQIKDKIKYIKRKHKYSFNYELKWTKVNYRNYQCIKEILGYLYSEESIHIRVLIAKGKNHLDVDKFHSTYDDWYYKMYYLLFKYPIEYKLTDSTCVNLFIDQKDSHSSEKIENLSRILNAKFKKNSKTITAKPCDSKEYILIQAIDIIIGLVAYNLKNQLNSPYKEDVLKYFKNTYNTNFTGKPIENQGKVNCFIWKPRAL